MWLNSVCDYDLQESLLEQVTCVKRHLVLRNKTTPTFTHPRSGFRHEAGVFRSVLSRAQRLFKVSESIASALDVKHMGLVQQSVQDCRGQRLVTGE